MVFSDSRVHPQLNKSSEPHAAEGHSTLGDGSKKAVGDEASVRTLSANSQDSADRVHPAHHSEEKARDAALYNKAHAKLQVRDCEQQGRGSRDPFARCMRQIAVVLRRKGVQFPASRPLHSPMQALELMHTGTRGNALRRCTDARVCQSL